MRDRQLYSFVPHSLELGRLRLRIDIRRGSRRGRCVGRGLDSSVASSLARGVTHHYWHDDCLEKVKSLGGNIGPAFRRSRICIFKSRFLGGDRGSPGLHISKRRFLSEMTQVDSLAHDE